MYNVKILSAAAKDVGDAVRWYGSKKKSLAKAFASEVRGKAKTIAKNPKAFAIRYADVRTLPMTKFPHMIHYQVDDAAGEVLIVAVLHTSINPDEWAERV